MAIGVVVGLVAGLGFGLVGGYTAASAARGSKNSPTRRGRFQLRRMFTRRHLLPGLRLGGGLGLGGGLVFGLVFVLRFGLGVGLVAGVVAGLAGVLAGGLAYGVPSAFADSENTSSPSPTVTWLEARNYAIVAGVLAGLVAGLAFGLGAVFMARLVAGLVSVSVLGLGFVFVAGLVVGLLTGVGIHLATSPTWSSALAMAQLAREWDTPVRLMKFLDDAGERGVLRTVGPAYQFRHARLQDRLADASHGSGNDSNTTSHLTHADNQPGLESAP